MGRRDSRQDFAHKEDQLRNVEFDPDWVVSPGATIADALNERGMSFKAFASSLLLSDEETSRLLAGALEIDDVLAARLAQTIGASPEFWLARERTFRANAPAIKQRWLAELPIKAMKEFGWISSVADDDDIEIACLTFFGVNDITEWRRRYGSQASLAKFRASKKHPMEFGAVAAWLRFGEIAARQMNCRPWDSAALVSSLPRVRSLTRNKDPQSFIPALQQLCAESGVAVVVAQTPPGCPVSGAARFLDAQLACVQLSFRYLSDDHFWFTFFHELGHLLLHPQRDFIETLDDEGEVHEQEANRFSAELLVPRRYWPEALAAANDYVKIIRVARKTGVSPGIVVGQLQHAGVLTARQKNFLKRRYEWQ